MSIIFFFFFSFFHDDTRGWEFGGIKVVPIMVFFSKRTLILNLCTEDTKKWFFPSMNRLFFMIFNKPWKKRASIQNPVLWLVFVYQVNNNDHKKLQKVYYIKIKTFWSCCVYSFSIYLFVKVFSDCLKNLFNEIKTESNLWCTKNDIKSFSQLMIRTT